MKCLLWKTVRSFSA